MCETAPAVGELGNFMWFCCNLAQALLELGRDDEAEQWLERGRETAPSEERLPGSVAPGKGKVLARRAEYEEGERVAREAVALAAETDMLNAHGDALRRPRRGTGPGRSGPRAELEQALALYERKGNLVMAERARAMLLE